MNNCGSDWHVSAFSRENATDTSFFTSSLAVSSPSMPREIEAVGKAGSHCNVVPVGNNSSGGGSGVMRTFESCQQTQESYIFSSRSSSQSSLRGPKSSFSFRVHSPPRIRPTSELPPTRFRTDVQQSVPMAIRAIENVCNSGSVLSGGTQQQQQQQKEREQPSPAAGQQESLETLSCSADSILKALMTSLESKSLLSTLAAVRGEQPARITTCQVCSLCGMSVILVGSLTERQQQWTDHEQSWVHQRNLQLRAAAQQCDLVSSCGGNAATLSQPITTTNSVHFPQSPGEILASSVSTVTEHMSTEGASALRKMYAPHEGDEAVSRKEDLSLFERETVNRDVFSADANVNVHKELFSDDYVHLQATSFSEEKKGTNRRENNEKKEEEDDGKELCSAECLAVNANAKSIEEEKRMTGEKDCEQSCGASAKGFSSRSKEKNELVGLKNTGQSSSSSLLQSASSTLLVETPVLSQKERKLERMLAAFLVKKERSKLLFCLRHWYNLMFLQVMDNSLGLSFATPSSARVTRKTAAKVNVTPIVATTSAKESGSVVTSAPAVCDLDVNQDRNKSPRNTADSASRREVPFMSSYVKDFARVPESSSLSSVEMEIAKTDVSWYIRPKTGKHKRPGRQKIPCKVEESLPRTSLESDANIAELISSLASPVRERVRAVLRDELHQQPCAFPKTTKMLCAMRSSSFTAASSNRAANFDVSGSDGRSLAFSSLPCATRSGSEEAVPLRGRGPGTTASVASLTQAAVSKDTVRECHVSENVVLESDAPQAICTRTEGTCEKRRLDFDSESVETKEGARRVANSASAFLKQEEQQVGTSSGCAFPSPAGDGSFSTSSFFSQEPRNKSVEACRESRIDEQSLPFSVNHQRSEEPKKTSLPPRLLCETQSRMKKGFRGVPGEFYCYYNGSYHRVSDPTSEVYFDEKGSRLPMFVVRRPTRPGTSPTRGCLLSTTRPFSPLGPGRINPYCSVCASRYFLVLVDEDMRSVAVTPQRQRGDGMGSNAPCACGGSSPGRFARSQGPRSRLSPRTLPRSRCCSASALPAGEARGGSSPPPAAPPSDSGGFGLHRTRKPASCSSNCEAARLSNAAAALTAKSQGLHGASCDVLPEEERQLRREVRRLRQHIKLFLCRELCERHESSLLADNVAFLKEAVQALEALLRERRVLEEDDDDK